MLLFTQSHNFFGIWIVLSVKYLYCNWHHFVFWVQVEQTESSSHMQRFTITDSSWYSIHLLLVIEEDIAFLYGQDIKSYHRYVINQGKRFPLWYKYIFKSTNFLPKQRLFPTQSHSSSIPPSPSVESFPLPGMASPSPLWLESLWEALSTSWSHWGWLRSETEIHKRHLPSSVLQHTLEE